MRRVTGPLAVVLAATLLAVAASAQPTGAVAGSVTDHAGEALPDATVTVVAVDCADGGQGCPRPRTATSRADGTWRAADVPAGEYHVHVADPSGASADQWWDGDTEPTDVVEVGDGGERDGVDFELTAAARVRGRVTDGDGRPVPGAGVSTARTPFSVARDTTDDQGRFTLAGLAGRTYEVVAVAGAGMEEAVATVTVSAGSSEDIELVTALLPVELVRLAGDSRVATAVTASQHAFDRAERVVVASAGSFPDALAAAPLATSLEAPLLLTGDRLDERVADEVLRLEAREAVVVGAVGAVPLVVQEDLERLGVQVRRVPGETRFDTAALIARDLGAPDGEAVVASGLEFPDALSVAPLAAAEGLPILLTPSATGVRDTAEALAVLGVDRTLVVGGPAAVSDDVAARLPSVTRLAGAERYATSVAVARELVRRGGELSTVSVATGRKFPDALAAGPVAARAGGPVLLVDGDDPAGAPASFEFLVRRRADVAELWVFGGTAAIAEDVTRHLRAAAGAP